MKLWNEFLVKTLGPILPVFAENTNEPVEVPCITYRLSSDAVTIEGDDLRYSRPVYQIKLYCKDLEEAEGYLQQIDTTLYLNRFVRESFNQLNINNLYQFIMNYSVRTRERLNNYGE